MIQSDCIGHFFWWSNQIILVEIFIDLGKILLCTWLVYPKDQNVWLIIMIDDFENVKVYDKFKLQPDVFVKLN